MIPYIVAYFINILFASCAERCYKQKSIYIASLFCIVLFDTIFIGFRDFGVGIDTTIYIDEYYLIAKGVTSIHEFLLVEGYDLGYLALAKISSLVSKESQSLMVMTELWIIGFTIAGLHSYKKVIGISIPVFITLYWLIYLCHSENLMRQYCAMALLFWGFSQLLRGRIKTYAVSQIGAFFFHSSSIVFLLVPIVYYISLSKSSRKKWLFAVLTFVAILVMLWSYYIVLAYVSKLGILKEVYSDRYGESSVYERKGEISFGMRYIVLIMVPAILIIWAYIKRVLKPEQLYMLVVLFFSMVLLEQLRFIMIYMFRLAHYYGLIYIVYMSNVVVSKKISYILKALWVVLLMVSFWKEFMVDGGLGWDYQYSSKILGI